MEGFLVHVISPMNYIEWSKLFKEVNSAKKVIDQLFLDLKEIQGYPSDLNKKLQQAKAKVAGSSKKSTEGTILGGPIPAGTAQATATKAKKKGTLLLPPPQLRQKSNQLRIVGVLRNIYSSPRTK